MRVFFTLCVLFISINLYGQELLVWVNLDDGKIIPNNTIQKNLNGSYITNVRALPFYDGYYLAALQRPYKYCIINSNFEIVSKLYDDLRIPPSSEITHKPLCLIYSVNNKGYGLIDLSDLNNTGKITEKTEPKYGTLDCFTPSNYFRGELKGEDKDGYLTTLGWHVLNDSGNLVFNYSEAPKSGHPEPFSDGFIGKPGYMPSTIVYNSNGEITRDYNNVVSPRNPCSGVIIDKDYCIVNEVKVNGFHTKAPLKHHIYNKENKLIFNSASEILWFFPETQIVLTQSGFLNLKGEKQLDKNKNFSDFFRGDWTEKNYQEYGLIQLQKTTQVSNKFVTSYLVLDKLGNILLKDIFDLLVLKNGLMSFNDISGYNSLYNPKNNETLTLPKNYALSLKWDQIEMFSAGYQSNKGLNFINNEFYPEFVYSDPKSSIKYYFDEIGNSSLVVDGNIGFPIEGKKGLRYLLEFAPQGSKFNGRVGNKILVAVPKNLLSSDGLKFNSTIAASASSSQNTGAKSETNLKVDAKTQDCNFPFSTQVPNLNITFVDNRKMCECCNKSYAQYKPVDKVLHTESQKVAYLNEVCDDYIRKNNINESQARLLRDCLAKYCLDKYGYLTNALGVTYSLPFSSLFTGVHNEKLSLERKVNAYTVDKYCSKLCFKLCDDE
jgi:hypothetical protein